MKKIKKLFYLILLTLAFSNLEAGRKKFAFSYRNATKKEQKQFSRDIKKHLRKIDKNEENIPKEIRILENLQLKGFGRISLPKLNLNKQQSLTILIIFMLLFANVSASVDYMKQKETSVEFIPQEEWDRPDINGFCDTFDDGSKMCFGMLYDYNVAWCVANPPRCVFFDYQVDEGFNATQAFFNAEEECKAKKGNYTIANEFKIFTKPKFLQNELGTECFVETLKQYRTPYDTVIFYEDFEKVTLKLFDIKEDELPNLNKMLNELDKKFQLINCDIDGHKPKRFFHYNEKNSDQAILKFTHNTDEAPTKVIGPAFLATSLEKYSDTLIFYILGHEYMHLKQFHLGRINIAIANNNKEAECDIISTLLSKSPCLAIYLSRYTQDPSDIPYKLQVITKSNMYDIARHLAQDRGIMTNYQNMYPDPEIRTTFILQFYHNYKKAHKALLASSYKFEEDYEDSYVEKIKDEL